ncbi:MAG TPA: carboxymuconolactone decarboxylase family protein [Hanamia sp.]|nr:carboxymuconolactone decarboxylase family protein [Hanamia sp.]
MKSEHLYSIPTRENAEARAKAAPEIIDAWRNFSKTVFKSGALDEKTKQLIAVAVAHVTQCPYCIHSHTEQAMRKGATTEEIIEAVWVAAEMKAGAAYSHSALAMDEIMAIEKSKVG